MIDKYRKAVERMEQMTDNELKSLLIEQYTNLQRIKKANGTNRNEELDYQIQATTAKLSAMSVNVEDLNL